MSRLVDTRTITRPDNCRPDMLARVFTALAVFSSTLAAKERSHCVVVLDI